jgi:hypothetical protein
MSSDARRHAGGGVVRDSLAQAFVRERCRMLRQETVNYGEPVTVQETMPFAVDVIDPAVEFMGDGKDMRVATCVKHVIEGGQYRSRCGLLCQTKAWRVSTM